MCIPGNLLYHYLMSSIDRSASHPKAYHPSLSCSFPIVGAPHPQHLFHLATTHSRSMSFFCPYVQSDLTLSVIRAWFYYNGCTSTFLLICLCPTVGRPSVYACKLLPCYGQLGGLAGSWLVSHFKWWSTELANPIQLSYVIQPLQDLVGLKKFYASYDQSQAWLQCPYTKLASYMIQRSILRVSNFDTMLNFSWT